MPPRTASIYWRAAVCDVTSSVTCRQVAPLDAHGLMLYSLIKSRSASDSMLFAQCRIEYCTGRLHALCAVGQCFVRACRYGFISKPSLTSC